MSLQSLLSNGSSINLGDCGQYAAILGLSPSKGARSPILWNAAFASQHQSARMLPFDIQETKLHEAMRCLREDPRFIGGAVAVPYKTRIISELDRVDEEAQAIGAVNSIYREGRDLVGSNTDGAAAVGALRQHFAQPLIGKKVTLLGLGGAGMAVAAYTAKEIGKDGTLTLISSDSAKADKIASKLSSYAKVHIDHYDSLKRLLPANDILINCSSVGMELWREAAQGVEYLRPFTPLGPISAPVSIPGCTRQNFLSCAASSISLNHSRTLEVLCACPRLFVYDIIYQPTRTMLLEIAAWAGLRVLNGEAMNLLQAVLAFQKATVASGMSKSDLDQVERAMRSCVVS